MKRKQVKPSPSILTHLNYRDGLVEFLSRAGWDAKDLVRKALDEHAHELANRQRQKLLDDGYGPDECVCGGCSWCLAQDYIGIIDPRREEM